MTPQDFGLPEQFGSYRPAQLEAFEYYGSSNKRCVAMGKPPGSGKSATAFTLAKMCGGRAVILTADLGLQDQYVQDFEGSGLVDMRGRSNFACWSGGTCEQGALLGCKEKLDCPYLCKLREWQASEIGLTSYAWWLTMAKLGRMREEDKPDLLILDEAHKAEEWLSKSLDFSIGEWECGNIGLKLQYKGESLEDWKTQALLIQDRAEQALVQAKHRLATGHPGQRLTLLKEIKRLDTLADRAGRVRDVDDGNWIIDRREGQNEGRVWHFECVWPGRYRERLLQNVKRVVFLSATLRPKTLALLGVARSDYEFKEWGRQFPAKNGPVIYLPTVRVNSKIDEEGRTKWLDRIEQITGSRNDRRGLIHSVSYARAKEISESLKQIGRNCIVNGAADPDSSTARQAFELFKRGPVDGILCSPSFSTGWDFKGKTAEYQIIAKLPIKDMRSKLMQARRERDPQYEDYLAAQDLVQACGRVQRSETDKGETLIIDNSIEWFYRKAEEFFPRWWKYRKETQLPKALPLLES